MNVIYKLLFPLGGYYRNEIGLSEAWSNTKPPFRPRKSGNWAFIVLNTYYIICWIDGFLKWRVSRPLVK